MITDWSKIFYFNLLHLSRITIMYDFTSNYTLRLLRKWIEFSSIAIPDHILQKFYIIHIQQITKTHVYKHLWESTKITMAWSKNVQGHSLTRTYHLCVYTATQLPIHSKKNRWVLNYRLSSCKSVLGLVFTFQRIISSFFFTL